MNELLAEDPKGLLFLVLLLLAPGPFGHLLKYLGLLLVGLDLHEVGHLDAGEVRELGVFEGWLGIVSQRSLVSELFALFLII